MVHYLYTLDYPAPLSQSPTSAHSVGHSDESVRPDDETTIRTPKDKKKRRALTTTSAAMSSPVVAETTCSIIDHVKVYALAEKYNIAALKSLARNKFQSAVSTHWDTADFAAAIHVVYTTTIAEDTGLREIVISTLQRHAALIKKPEVEATLRELNGLSFDLLKRTWLDAQYNDHDGYYRGY